MREPDKHTGSAKKSTQARDMGRHTAFFRRTSCFSVGAANMLTAHLEHCECWILLWGLPHEPLVGLGRAPWDSLGPGLRGWIGSTEGSGIR